MKYIRFQDDSVILFSDFIDHDRMAGNKPVKSAGFCIVETHRNKFDDIRATAQCYGASMTLGIQANPADAELIERIWR